MKYITIPAPVTMTSKDLPDEQLSFAEFLRNHVWGAPVWRDSGDNAVAFADAFGKLDVAQVGDIVGLTDAAFEVLKPLAILKGRT